MYETKQDDSILAFIFFTLATFQLEISALNINAPLNID